MTTRSQYYALIAELEAIEKQTGAYLADTAVDAENAELPHDHPEFYTACYRSACTSAGSRAEDAGIDLHKLLGRVIY